MRLSLKCLNKVGVDPLWATLLLCLSELMGLIIAGWVGLSFRSQGRERAWVFYLTLTKLSQDHLCACHWFQGMIGLLSII
jgi:hypothetical protein